MIDTKPKTVTLHENHSTLHISHTFPGTHKYNVYVIWYDKEFRNSFRSLISKEEALKDIWVVNDTFQNKRLGSLKIWLLPLKIILRNLIGNYHVI